jgi:hypothetical protein
MKNMRKKVIWSLALTLSVFALAAGSAFADGTGPTGATGPAGPPHGKFSCDAAKARLAKAEALIALIQKRIASGHVKDPSKAAAFLANVQKHADAIQARITKRGC